MDTNIVEINYIIDEFCKEIELRKYNRNKEIPK